MWYSLRVTINMRINSSFYVYICWFITAELLKLLQFWLYLGYYTCCLDHINMTLTIRSSQTGVDFLNTNLTTTAAHNYDREFSGRGNCCSTLIMRISFSDF